MNIFMNFWSSSFFEIKQKEKQQHQHRSPEYLIFFFGFIFCVVINTNYLNGFYQVNECQILCKPMMRINIYIQIRMTIITIGDRAELTLGVIVG